jgi:hypothetical protein
MRERLDVPCPDPACDLLMLERVQGSDYEAECRACGRLLITGVHHWNRCHNYDLGSLRRPRSFAVSGQVSVLITRGDGLVTTAQAAQIAKRSPVTIRSWVQRDHLKPRGMDERGHPLYDPDDVARAEKAVHDNGLRTSGGRLDPRERRRVAALQVRRCRCALGGTGPCGRLLWPWQARCEPCTRLCVRIWHRQGRRQRVNLRKRLRAAWAAFTTWEDPDVVMDRLVARGREIVARFDRP